MVGAVLPVSVRGWVLEVLEVLVVVLLLLLRIKAALGLL